MKPVQLTKRIEAIGVKGPMTRDGMTQQYSSGFKGLHVFPGVHHIHADPNITPIVHGCRTIPLAIRNRLKSTVHELLRAEVITPVQDPTDLVNSLVITDNKICVFGPKRSEQDYKKTIFHHSYT